MTTVQAQRVIDALKAVGLKHGSYRTSGDFTVSTDVTRRRFRNHPGRYSEFGDAIGHVRGREANAKVEANAETLVRDYDLTVTLVYIEERLISAIVTSRNPHGTLSILRDGAWSYRRVS